MRRGIAVPIVATLLSACVGPDDAGPLPSAAPSPAPTASPSVEPTRPDPSSFRGRLVRIAVVPQAVALAVRPGDPGLYVAAKTGQIVSVDDRGAVTPLLDISGEVTQGYEQGLLGLAFSPDGAFLYLNYTDLAGDTHVTEFAVDGGRIDEASRRDVLVVDQPYSNHNGGHVAFGPDGYLYVGLGDGGSSGDPEDNAQALGRLLGKMLRIDPRPRGTRPYGIPDDNPFVGTEGARREIWALGLRNPWRYSFDRATGDLWIGDVGQNRVEEIDFQPAASRGGENYGWDGYEGTLPFEEPLPADAVAPLHEYGQDLGRSVIGGYVYRGSAIPELQGAYIFGDFFEPELRALVPPGGDRPPKVTMLGVGVPDLASLGEDAEGELYALSLSGGLYRLAP